MTNTPKTEKLLNTLSLEQWANLPKDAETLLIELELDLSRHKKMLELARHSIVVMRNIIVDTTEDLRSVLCDPDDICCIDGSDQDRSIVNQAIVKLHDTAIAIGMDKHE